MKLDVRNIDKNSIWKCKFLLCKARPELNGALFVIAVAECFYWIDSFFAITKKREWSADIGAQMNLREESRSI